MNYEELKDFKEQTHDPVMKELFDRTELKEGSAIIDFMHISYPDCRNCGFDSRMYVSGLQYSDGEVSKYEYEMCDATVKEFFDKIKSIPFLYDSKVIFEDELKSIMLETELHSTDNCVPLFPEAEDIAPIKRLISSIEYEKMKYLYSKEEQSQENCEEIEIGGMQM